MLEKIINLNNNLKETTCISKREFCLMLISCTAIGLLVGILISPKRAIKIGCNNGNNNGNHS